MNKKQKEILMLMDSEDFGSLTLREIGSKIGLGNSPQAVKYHLIQLEKKGLIEIDKENRKIKKVTLSSKLEAGLLTIPILGAANCGEATLYAEERFGGFLRISPKIINKTENIFAIRAEGDSMNKAYIQGKSIEDGDYVIVDASDRTPKKGDYVLSTIEGHANIKKFLFDKDNNQIVLISESDKNYPPIFIHPEDNLSYIINGKVIQVIKMPK